MSTSTHNIAIRGKDQTATAFQSIQARAIAAGAHLSVRAIKGGNAGTGDFVIGPDTSAPTT